ncbi:S8 family serine peptidase [Fibrobacterota bacterium]
MRKIVYCLSVIFLIASSHAKMSEKLAQQIGKAYPNEMISCIVIMRTRYPFEEMKRAILHNKIKTFRNIAEESQRPLLQWLEAKSGDAEVRQRYWVLNGFHLKAKPSIIKQVALRDDVEIIADNGVYHILPAGSPSYQAAYRRGIEWNILKVMADSCWNAGFTGDRIILAMTDTGIDYLHPALAGKWTGDWHVAQGVGDQTELPYDDHGHGTHCMGTILGGDGPGPFEHDVGIAVDATFVVAKVLNGAGSGTDDQVIEGLQFIADLKDSVDIKAVSNSWGDSVRRNLTMYPVCRTLKSLGIFPVFAIGNDGPGDTTDHTPGNYAHVLGVGATNIDDNIADFSSRGPSLQEDPWNNTEEWLRDDWNYIKPQISAPGYDIFSCQNHGGYKKLNGTSMACPHVVGAIGIICQKNPYLTPEELYSALLDNADQVASGLPNNTFGWGRLNVWKALNGAPAAKRPMLHVFKREITDPAPGGNNNDLLEPGETGQMVVTVKNVGARDGKNTTWKLESRDNYVRINNGLYNYGNLLPDGSASNSGSPHLLDVHLATPQGHSAPLALVLHADGEHDSLDFNDTVLFHITIGTSPGMTVIYEDDFEYGGGIDSFSNYWETTGNWAYTSDQSHSQIHSVSSNNYSSSNNLTLKNGVDLSLYAQPEVVFWSRNQCGWPENWKECGVTISTDNGNSWNFVTTVLGDATEQWSEQKASLFNASVDNVKIKFHTVAKGMNDECMFWIDDFRIRIPIDIEPPIFSNTTLWKETYLTGPFDVASTITDVNGVGEVALYYRVNSATWNKLAMSQQGADVYKVSIPAQSGNGTIDYYLEATDKWSLGTANKGTFPIGSSQNSDFHSFVYGSTDIINNQQLVQFSISKAQKHSGLIHIQFYLPYPMRVMLSVFDIKGRKVASLLDNKVNRGVHMVTWGKNSRAQNSAASGVYFVTFEAHDSEIKSSEGKYKKIVKILLAN